MANSTDLTARLLAFAARLTKLHAEVNDFAIMDSTLSAYVEFVSENEDYALLTEAAKRVEELERKLEACNACLLDEQRTIEEQHPLIAGLREQIAQLQAEVAEVQSKAEDRLSGWIVKARELKQENAKLQEACEASLKYVQGYADSSNIQISTQLEGQLRSALEGK